MTLGMAERGDRANAGRKVGFAIDLFDVLQLGKVACTRCARPRRGSGIESTAVHHFISAVGMMISASGNIWLLSLDISPKM